MRKIISDLIIIIIILLTMLSGNTYPAQGNSVRKQILDDIVRDNLQTAGQRLDSACNVLDMNMVNAYRAVIRYAEPGWYQDDVSGLKNTAPLSTEIVEEIISHTPSAVLPKKEKIKINATRLRFITAISHLGGDSSVDSLINLLNDRDARIRYNTVQTLMNLKLRAAAKPLFDYLQTDHTPDYSMGNVSQQLRLEALTRKLVIETLVAIKNPDIIPDLEKLLDRKGSSDRLISATILTGYQSIDLLPLYRKLLNDNDDEIRIYAGSALKAIGYDDGLPVLMDLFRKGDTATKLRLLDTLSWWEDQDLAKLFIDHLHQQAQNQVIGYIPLSQQGKVHPETDLANRELLLSWKILQTLIQWKTMTPPLIMSEISSKRGNFRFLAIEIVAETGYEPALEPLRKNLDSLDPQLVYYSIWALGRMNDRESIKKMRELLYHDDVFVAVASAWTLAKLGDDSGKKIALAGLFSGESSLESTLLSALYFMRKPDTVSAVTKVLQQKKDYLSFESIRLLGILSKDSSNSANIARQSLPAVVSGIFPLSFYGAEALYLATSGNISYRSESEPSVVNYYGKSPFSTADYARYALLYAYLNPHIFGPVSDSNIAMVNVPATIEINGKPLILNRGDKLPVVEIKGKSVKTAVYNSESIQEIEIPFRNVTLLPRIIENTWYRMKQDLGFRWKQDIKEILKRDYFSELNTMVEFSSPLKSTSAFQTATALETAIMFCHCPEQIPDSRWTPVMSAMKPGERIIRAGFGREREILLNLEPAGKLRAIKTIKKIRQKKQ